MIKSLPTTNIVNATQLLTTNKRIQILLYTILCTELHVKCPV